MINSVMYCPLSEICKSLIEPGGPRHLDDWISRRNKLTKDLAPDVGHGFD